MFGLIIKLQHIELENRSLCGLIVLRVALTFLGGGLYLLNKCFSIQKLALMNFFGKTSYKISVRLAILTCKSVFNQIATKQKATLYNILFFVRLSSIVECSHLKM